MKKRLFSIFPMACVGVLSISLSCAITPALAAHSVDVNSTFNSAATSAGNKQGTQYQYTRYQGMDKKQQENIASNFDLTPKEYQQYLYDMKYTPDRYYYAKDTSPLMVLAAHNINNRAKFAYYTKKAAEIAFAESTRILLAIKVMHLQMKALHPHVYPIMTKQMQAKNLQAGDRVRLLCHLNSTLCDNVINETLPVLKKSPGVHLDIFIVGHGLKASELQAFAQMNNLPMSLVNQGVITLNFGNTLYGQYLSESKTKHVSLPLVQVLKGHQIINATLGNNRVK